MEKLGQSQGQRHFLGVCYFDSTERSWMVLEQRGRCLPRHSSPVSESQSFVIYDNARCRGADLQLKPKAVGLLTLGPATCKDQMMQAAGRLRQVGRGQTLYLAGTSEVTAKICHFNHRQSASLQVSAKAQSTLQNQVEPGPRDVLQWVMHNTVEATQQGILPWAEQGLFFAATKERPDRAMQDEVQELHDMYSAGRRPQPVGDLVQQLAVVADKDGSMASGMKQLVERLCESSARFGRGHMVVSGPAVNEECEREMEKEEEEEEEVEKQVPSMEVAKEHDWDYLSAMDAASPIELAAGAGVLDLKIVAAALRSESVHRIQWADGIYCTSNFVRTVAAATPVQNEYLRPVGALLLFPEGQMLLVSEREADSLLELLWCYSSNSISLSSSSPLLLSLAFIRQAHEAETGCLPRLACRVSKSSWALQDGIGRQERSVLQAVYTQKLVSLQVFDGNTAFPTQQQRACLSSLMRGNLKAAEELTSMRGKQAKLPRSNLKDACEGTLSIT